MGYMGAGSVQPLCNHLAFWDRQVMAELTVTEHQHQCALFQWWKIAHKHYHVPEKALYHTPNEGKRSFMAGKKLQAEGMRKGVPDIVLAVPSSGYGALYIELKTAKGRVSKEQLDYLSLLDRCGNKAVLCRGWVAAKAVIEEYLQGRGKPLAEDEA